MEILRRTKSLFENKTKKKLWYDVSINYRATTSLWVLNNQNNKVFRPYVAKFSPHEHLFIASGCEEGKVALINGKVALDKRKTSYKINSFTASRNAIFDLVFTDKPKTICIGSADQNVYFVDFESGITVSSHEGHNASVRSLCKTAVGILSGGRDGKVFCWDNNLTEPVFSVSPKKKMSVTSLVSPNSYMFITSSNTGEIQLYDMRKPYKIVCNIPHPNPQIGISSLSLSPDGQLMASVAKNGNVTFHRLDSNWEYSTRNFVVMDTFYNRCCFSPCSKYLMIGSDLGAIHIFSVQRNIAPISIPCHSDAATCVDWDGTFDFLLSTSDDCSLAIWCADYQTPQWKGDLPHTEDDFMFTTPPTMSVPQSYTLYHFLR